MQDQAIPSNTMQVVEWWKSRFHLAGCLMRRRGQPAVAGGKSEISSFPFWDPPPPRRKGQTEAMVWSRWSSSTDASSDDNHQQHRLSSHCDLSSWFLLLLHPWCVDVADNKILHTLLVALLVEYLVLFCSQKSEPVDHNLRSASDLEARRNKSGIVAEEETIEAMPWQRIVERAGSTVTADLHFNQIQYLTI